MALRWLRPTDTLAFLRDPRVMWDYPPDLAWPEPQAVIARARHLYQEHGFGFFACERAGEVIGMCGLLPQHIDGGPQLEVGYRFAFADWGRGLATEAARAVRDWAFRSQPAEHLISIIRPDNAASCRVAEKNGMRFAKLAHWEKIKAEMRLYRITRAEWLDIASPQR